HLERSVLHQFLLSVPARRSSDLSLSILLTSESGRAMLATVGSVIVDEIHALAPNKRGAHLSLSLARLDALTHARPLRIGLSATQDRKSTRLNSRHLQISSAVFCL